MRVQTGGRDRLLAAVALVAVFAVVAACAGSEARTSPGGTGSSVAVDDTTGTTGPGGSTRDGAGPGSTGPGGTGPGGTGDTSPPTTEDPLPPGAAVEDLGALTEANPAVGGTPYRDVGISVRLADGRLLWVFGDTLHAGQVLSNSAGTSEPGSTAIYDGVDGRGRLVPFIPFTPEEEAYNAKYAAGGSRWVLWPNAAVAVDGGRRVLVFFERSITTLLPGGGSSTGPSSRPVIGVAEWVLPPSGSRGPIQARRVNDEAFTGANLNAAYLDASGQTMWLLSCVQNGRCLTARVPVAQATDGSKWQWWTGGGYSPDVRQGAPLAFPDPESEAAGLTYPGGAPFAAAPFAGGNIVWDPERQLYLMGFTSWPGYARMGYLRAARQPTGPWGPPLRFHLPGCDTPDCYAVSVHPDLSRGPSTMGVSYHKPHLNRAAVVDISTLTPG